MKNLVTFACMGMLLANAQVKPVITQRTFVTRPQVVRLAPRYSTAIRMPEPVSSVVVGDPAKFLVEHSDKEPALVLVKPVVEEAAESNLLITTVNGSQASFVLRTNGSKTKPVDFVVIVKRFGTFLIGEADLGSMETPGSETLRSSSEDTVASPMRKTAFESNGHTPDSTPGASSKDAIAKLLERQQRAPLPALFGMRVPSAEGKGDRIRAGVSEVVDEGSTVIVLFSVVNPQKQPIEVLAPQIQLAGKLRKGIGRRSRWGSSEQLPVQDFRLSRRRLAAGARADGIVVFTRPGFKQSSESLFLQIAESGAVDKPALAPIGFGVSAVHKEASHGE